MRQLGTILTALSVLALLAAGPVAGAPRQVQDPDTLGFWKGSALIGTSVKDAQGKDIGKIEDLMVDERGRVRYAILSFGGFLGIGDKLFAVPWSAMRFDDRGRDLKAVALDVTKEMLERAPSFARDRWPDPRDRKWDEELGRYWHDATVTATVKSKLAAEKLDTLARVDVDTRQGVVQLNGTVDSERTKQRATAVARQVRGVRQVVNNLKVQARS